MFKHETPTNMVFRAIAFLQIFSAIIFYMYIYLFLLVYSISMYNNVWNFFFFSKFSFGKTPPKKPDVSKKGKHKKELAKISQMIAQQKNQKRRGGKMKQLKRKRRKK